MLRVAGESHPQPPPPPCVLGFHGDTGMSQVWRLADLLKEVNQSKQEGGVFPPVWKTQMTSAGASLVFCDTNSELPRAVGLNPIIHCSTQEA